MKKAAIKLIRLYQNTPIPTHNRCKFVPSCSEYMAQAIEKYGTIRGIGKGIKRIVRCNPFNKGGYDPVK